MESIEGVQSQDLKLKIFKINWDIHIREMSIARKLRKVEELVESIRRTEPSNYSAKYTANRKQHIAELSQSIKIDRQTIDGWKAEIIDLSKKKSAEKENK
jgi:hypothetical protein